MIPFIIAGIGLFVTIVASTAAADAADTKKEVEKAAQQKRQEVHAKEQEEWKKKKDIELRDIAKKAIFQHLSVQGKVLRKKARFQFQAAAEKKKQAEVDTIKKQMNVLESVSLEEIREMCDQLAILKTSMSVFTGHDIEELCILEQARRYKSQESNNLQYAAQVQDLQIQEKQMKHLLRECTDCITALENGEQVIFSNYLVSVMKSGSVDPRGTKKHLSSLKRYKVQIEMKLDDTLYELEQLTTQ